LQASSHLSLCDRTVLVALPLAVTVSLLAQGGIVLTRTMNGLHILMVPLETEVHRQSRLDAKRLTDLLRITRVRYLRLNQQHHQLVPHGPRWEFLDSGHLLSRKTLSLCYRKRMFLRKAFLLITSQRVRRAPRHLHPRESLRWHHSERWQHHLAVLLIYLPDLQVRLMDINSVWETPINQITVSMREAQPPGVIT
jgi:hypothetical protein